MWGVLISIGIEYWGCETETRFLFFCYYQNQRKIYQYFFIDYYQLRFANRWGNSVNGKRRHDVVLFYEMISNLITKKKTVIENCNTVVKDNNLKYSMLFNVYEMCALSVAIELLCNTTYRCCILIDKNGRKEKN